MAKMLGNTKRFGRCRVEGHGSKCECSIDIQSTAITRTEDKREWKAFIQNELDELENDLVEDIND